MESTFIDSTGFETLIISFLSIGNNDYSGRIWGMSSETAYKTLKYMTRDLACLICQDTLDASQLLPEHLFTLFSSKCRFSVSNGAFQEFIKLLYIEKNIKLFRDELELPLPSNIKKWKKFELENAFNFLSVEKTCANGKSLTVPKMKDKLLLYFVENPSEKQKLKKYMSKGKKPSELDFLNVQKKVWLNKNPRDWCPSSYQVLNLYGRIVLTCLLFSVTEYFPPRKDLEKFGYKLEGQNILFNLKTSNNEKEKNVRSLLAAIGKKRNINEEIQNGSKKRTSNITSNNSTKRHKNSPENLIE